MEGKAPGGPKAKGVQNVPERIELLQRFEQWADLKKLPLEQIIGEEKWHAYWSALAEIENKMRQAQTLADEIQQVLATQTSVSEVSHPSKDHG